MLLETIAMLCISASNNKVPDSDRVYYGDGKERVYALPQEDTPRGCQIRLLKCLKKKEDKQLRQETRNLEKREKQSNQWEKENCKKETLGKIETLTCGNKMNPFTMAAETTVSEYELKQKLDAQENLIQCLLEQQ